MTEVQRKTDIVITTPVWGAEYTRFFVDVVLRTMLSEGNLPALHRIRSCLMVIHTCTIGREILNAAPSFQHLLKLMPVVVKVIEPAWRYDTMNICHRDCLKIAEEMDAAILVLSPDAMWSSGSLGRLGEIMESGKTFICLAGMRAAKEGFMSELSRLRLGSEYELTVSARTIMDIALRNLHRITKTHIWNSGEEGLMPSALIWRVGDEGVLYRGLNLAAIYVKPQRWIKFRGTSDGFMVDALSPDSSGDYIVTDSDEILCLELTTQSRDWGTTCRNGSIGGVVNFAEMCCSRRTLDLSKAKIRLHRGECTESLWRQVEAESDDVVQAIVARRTASFGSIIIRHPDQAIARARAFLMGSGDFNGIQYPFAPTLVAAYRGLWSWRERLTQMIFFSPGPRAIDPGWIESRVAVDPSINLYATRRASNLLKETGDVLSARALRLAPIVQRIGNVAALILTPLIWASRALLGSVMYSAFWIEDRIVRKNGRSYGSNR